MKRRIYGAKSALVFTCLILAGCLAQSPAPVTHYGSAEGAGSAGVHTVTPGENLWDISQRYNIVMRDIVVSNHLNAPFVLNTGQRLRLPAPKTHKVRRGDSVSKVSRLYAVSASEVVRINSLSSPYVLRPGQVLRLPSVSPQARPAVYRTASIVQPGISAPAAPVPQVERGGVVSPPANSDVTPDRKPIIPDVASVQKASIGTGSGARTASRGVIPNSTPKRSSSKFLMPVKGDVISSYGAKKDGLHNDGINIRAAKGTSIRAAENGVVVYAGNELKGSGNLILVRHADRWMTAYAHLDRMDVQRGDVLERGQIIGTVGQSGSVDSPQLHFEVRRGTDAINPSKYVES